MNYITKSKKYYGELAYKTFSNTIGSNIIEFEELPESIKNGWISTGWNIFNIARYYSEYTIEEMINDLDDLDDEDDLDEKSKN